MISTSWMVQGELKGPPKTHQHTFHLESSAEDQRRTCKADGGGRILEKWSWGHFSRSSDSGVTMQIPSWQRKKRPIVYPQKDLTILHLFCGLEKGI